MESRTGAFKSLMDLRFQSPLIEPDMRISRSRLSDKTAGVRPRKGLGEGFALHEPQPSVEVRVREAGEAVTPDLVLMAQPPAQPTDRVTVRRSIALAHWAEAEVPRAAPQQLVAMAGSWKARTRGRGTNPAGPTGSMIGRMTRSALMRWRGF